MMGMVVQRMSERRSALGVEFKDLHRHRVSLTSAKDALWCLPLVWQGADVFHPSHDEENSKTRTERSC